MTAATVIDFPARPEGRPSNATLQLENRSLRAALADIADERDELDAELHAYVTERLAVAAEIVALARRGQFALAAGHSPVRQLQDMERLGNREQVRARGMRSLGGAA